MTGRDVLFVLLVAFFLAALALIYNGYYRPVSTSGVGLPATAEPR